MEKRAIRLNELLYAIHRLLEQVEGVDPYGDIIENFEDGDRTRVTTRLMEMVKEDIDSGYWRKR